MGDIILKRKISTFFTFSFLVAVLSIAMAIISFFLFVPIENGRYAAYYEYIVNMALQMGLNIDSEYLYSTFFFFNIGADIVVIVLAVLAIIFSFKARSNLDRAPKEILNHKASLILPAIFAAITGVNQLELVAGVFISGLSFLQLVIAFFGIFSIFRMKGIFTLCKMLIQVKDAGINIDNNPINNPFFFQENNEPQRKDDSEIIDATITKVEEPEEKKPVETPSPIIDIEGMYEELANLEKDYKNGKITKDEYEMQKLKIYERHNYK